MIESLHDATENLYVQPPYVREVPGEIRDAVGLQEAGTFLEEPKNSEKVLSDEDFAVLVEKLLSEIGNEHPYHNRRHTEEVMARLEVLMDQCEPELSPRQRQLNLLRALFHDIGHCGRTIRQDCGDTYEEPVHDREDVSNEEYAALRVRKELDGKEGVTEDDIVYIQTGILGTTYGQASGPYKRAYAARSATEKLIAFADVGKVMDIPSAGASPEEIAAKVDEWIDESFRVTEEMSPGQLPQDFGAFMNARISFLGYVHSLCGELPLNAAYRDQLMQKIDFLRGTFVLWRDSALHTDALLIHAREAGAVREWQALQDIAHVNRHKARFEKLWHERACSIADSDLLTRLFSKGNEVDGTSLVTQELESELCYLPNRSITDSDFVGWYKVAIEQIYLYSYTKKTKRKRVRMRKVVQDAGTRWVIGRKKKKHQESSVTKKERTIGVDDGTQDAEEVQRLWQYRKDPTLIKTRYYKEFTFVYEDESYTVEIHCDVHHGPGNLKGFVRIELEFKDDTAAQTFRRRKEAIIQANRSKLPDFIGVDVTNDTRYKASELVVHGRPSTYTP